MSSVQVDVVGLAAPDEKWIKMKTVLDACKEAGVRVPREVRDFFGKTDPGDDGRMEVDLKAHRRMGDMCETIDIYVCNMPQDVEVIRVTVNYDG